MKLSVLILIFLVSCTTTKHVEKVRLITDSTAIKELDLRIKTYQEDSAGYTSMIEMLSHNDVIFRDTGSTKIEYYPDGAIKTVEGPVRKASAVLTNKQLENYVSKHTYDSLAAEKSKETVRYVTEFKDRNLYIEKRLPWWLFLGCAVVGGIIWEWFRRRVKPKANNNA